MKNWLRIILAALMGFGASVPVLEPELLQLGLSALGWAGSPTVSQSLPPPDGDARHGDARLDSAQFYETLPPASDTLADDYVATQQRLFTSERRAERRKWSQEEEKIMRIGAICRDGSATDNEGGGACSGHGGVKRWLYKGDEAVLDAWEDKSEHQRMAFAPSARPGQEDPYRLFWYFCVAMLATILILALMRLVFRERGI